MKGVRGDLMFVAMVSAFLAGCGATRYTKQERDVSFLPHRFLTVGHLGIRDYLGNASGILIDGVQFSHSKTADATLIPKEGRFNAQGEWSVGTATAIDPRGYFVTASHCVEGEEISLIFPSAAGTKVSDARIVWRGGISEGGMDFAVLHVPSRLDQVFRWGTEINSDDTVIGAGVNMDRKRLGSDGVDMKFQIELVSGRILKALEWQDGALGYHVILHDAPVIDGFSGGPLVSKDGRLLGIHSSGRARFPIRWNKRMRFANAIRPDLDWLTDLIERDHLEWGQLKK